ncbi:MAG: DUF998 domain-containing protein [Hyphomicrobium sp.]|nr:DUF998 domain-containing protein [Hyphomicrobium sp.]
MGAIDNQLGVGTPSQLFAMIAIVATVISLAALSALHVVSPQFAPSWRMVSEYANGSYPWLLTIVFHGWAAGSFALLLALWPLSASTLGKIGLVFLFLAGIGQVMGGLFDINHKLHGPAAMIGIPSLCIAAVLLTLAMAQQAGFTAPPAWSAHLPWISFVLMLGAFALFMSALKGAGIDVSSQTSPLKELPAGVSGYVGWANRLLFAAAYTWTALTSLAVMRSGAAG